MKKRNVFVTIVILVLYLIVFSVRIENSLNQKRQVTISDEIKSFVIEHYNSVIELKGKNIIFNESKNKEIYRWFSKFHESSINEDENKILRDMHNAYVNLIRLKNVEKNNILLTMEFEERLYNKMDIIYDFLTTYCEYEGERIINE